MGRPSVILVVAYDRARELPRPVVHATLDTKDYDAETGEQEILWIETSTEYRRRGYATEVVEGLKTLGWEITLAPGSTDGTEFIDFLATKHRDWF